MKNGTFYEITYCGSDETVGVRHFESKKEATKFVKNWLSSEKELFDTVFRLETDGPTMSWSGESGFDGEPYIIMSRM